MNGLLIAMYVKIVNAWRRDALFPNKMHFSHVMPSLLICFDRRDDTSSGSSSTWGWQTGVKTFYYSKENRLVSQYSGYIKRITAILTNFLGFSQSNLRVKSQTLLSRITQELWLLLGIVFKVTIPDQSGGWWMVPSNQAVSHLTPGRDEVKLVV